MPLIAASGVALLFAFEQLPMQQVVTVALGRDLKHVLVLLLATVNMGSCTMWLALIDEFLEQTTKAEGSKGMDNQPVKMTLALSSVNCTELYLVLLCMTMIGCDCLC